jgi:hypothetical protein
MDAQLVHLAVAEMEDEARRLSHLCRGAAAAKAPQNDHPLGGRLYMVGYELARGLLYLDLGRPGQGALRALEMSLAPRKSGVNAGIGPHHARESVCVACIPSGEDPQNRVHLSVGHHPSRFGTGALD